MKDLQEKIAYWRKKRQEAIAELLKPRPSMFKQDMFEKKLIVNK